ncbi:MAG: response regulator [Oscillospiraceae bacterium]|nr:response regulator [Oscillospiraceae bacterium]
MKTIFIADDNTSTLMTAMDALSSQYQVYTMLSSAKMFAMLEKTTPDLILLDIEMPEMDGFDTLRKLKSNSVYAGIPVIFLTSRTDPKDEIYGLRLGAVDYITKPFNASVLLNRVHTHTNISEVIRESATQVKTLKNGIVTILADIVEARDASTGGHNERTSSYIRILFEAMTEQGVYADEMADWNIETVVSSALLHDIGKIAIPDAILKKPGKLTPEEYEIIKTHAIEGERIITRIADHAGDGVFLRHARLFAGSHHERWDGSGYPRGLKGVDIPLQGRIMSIADVYDALVSERPYKAMMTCDKANDIIIEGAGGHFDPVIVDVFRIVQDRFQSVTQV